jgi:hypothetical protein
MIFKFMSIAVFGVFLACTGREKPSVGQAETASEANANQQTEAEEPGEWISLFDGKTLDGWKRYNADEIGPLWRVEDGAILCDGEGEGEGSPENGGSLITLESFGNFELELEWKISEGGNSGILYHVVEKPEYSHAYVTGPEYQVMDDSQSSGNAKNLAGSNYDMYAAPSTKILKPVGEWNTAKIVYNDGKVEHWLNGQKVVEFDESSEDFRERYEQSKWASGDYPAWNTYKEGAIGLQDHGHKVWYRNIRIKKL